MSGVTVLIGQTSLTSVQMTRRINKVILHSQYNAANYVSLSLFRSISIIRLIHNLRIWIRPTISPSWHWTRPSSFPGVFHLFACHQPAPTRTNTPTNVPFCWDGERLVRSPTKDGLVYYSSSIQWCNMRAWIFPEIQHFRIECTKRRSSTRQGWHVAHRRVQVGRGHWTIRYRFKHLR